MRRTLLLIPHEIAGVPVFGVGWLLLFVLIGVVVRIVIARRANLTLGNWLATEGIMWLLVAVAVVFLLPAVELKNVLGDPVGMAIRGYGVMLVMGVASAVLLAAYRAKSRGIDPEVIYSLAPWLLVGGIVGARLFYVIQYRDNFSGATVPETIGNMLKFTEGGLVVYGSFIGGFFASVTYVCWHRLSVLKMGDIIVPCLFLGLFFGRIGCLMNGCCYGGRCEEGWSASHFPPGSPVYQDQLLEGELLGLDVDAKTQRVTEVRPESLAESAGIRSEQFVNQITYDDIDLETAPKDIPAEDVPRGAVVTSDGRVHRWAPAELPPRALPVHPAQIISSISGLVLCLALCSISFWKLRDGTVMMLGFGGYAILRFVLELIRVDEAGQFGTELSISQWLSIVVLMCSATGLVWIVWRPNPSEGTAI